MTSSIKIEHYLGTIKRQGNFSLGNFISAIWSFSLPSLSPTVGSLFPLVGCGDG